MNFKYSKHELLFIFLDFYYNHFLISLLFVLYSIFLFIELIKNYTES